MHKDDIEIFNKHVESIMTAVGNLNEENQEKLMRVFIQRSIAFEQLMSIHKRFDSDADNFLRVMGAQALAAIDLYDSVVNKEDEDILYKE